VCAIYEEDFESLDRSNPSALANNGWSISGNVSDGFGTLKLRYGPFNAPNGGPGFSAIVNGEGGAPQGSNQLSIYNDYNCCDPQGHDNGTDVVESNVFQEPFPALAPIPARDIGKTVVFSFDAKRGDINDPSGSSTALAFIKTLDPDAGFAQTNFVTVDTTNLATSWNRLTISLPLTDPQLEGQILQFGFLTTASNFEPSGNFYDNILVTK
jgi:hypothetical protein